MGSLAGALLAPRIATRFGVGPTIITGFAISPLAQVPLLLAGPGPGWQIVLAGTLAAQLFWATASGVSQRSLRQVLCAPRFQGRMQRGQHHGDRRKPPPGRRNRRRTRGPPRRPGRPRRRRGP
ncbi:hypothetical protein [Streptomyces subrutilus]|nr:hypothetical protein [Streptomyces subrutilus]